MNNEAKIEIKQFKRWLNKKFSDIAIEDLGIGVDGRKRLVQEIVESVNKEREQARLSGIKEVIEKVLALVNEYDESPDDMAGFEIRIKKAVEFRTKLQEMKEREI